MLLNILKSPKDLVYTIKKEMARIFTWCTTATGSI
jgi:hypothetical protein